MYNQNVINHRIRSNLSDLTLTLCVTNKNPKSSHFFFLLQILDMISYPDYCGVACGDIGAGFSQKPEKLRQFHL